MLKDTRTYVDYNGVTRTEDFYFNLTETEIIEMEMGVAGGLSEMIKKMIAANDGVTIMSTIKTVIKKAYGEKSPDGKRFIKSDELSEAYMQTEAYNQLFLELVTDAEKSSNFINGITPNKKESLNVLQGVIDAKS